MSEVSNTEIVELLKHWYQFRPRDGSYWGGSWHSMLNGLMPVRLIKTVDKSRSYEMDAMHLFEMENGEYLTISEMGCSCYDSSQADLQLHPNLADAETLFHRWENNSYGW